MKKSLILLVAALLAFGGSAFAQKNVKLGHINSGELMKIMPGVDSLQNVLQREVNNVKEQATAMENEIQKKQEEYTQGQSQWSELIRNTKQQELQEMFNRYQVFQENAQESLQELNQKLLEPIQERAMKAIQDVAKENGFTYIFEESVLYYKDGGEDILPLVKKKLGISK